MNADFTRQEVAFMQWDIPKKKQTDLPALQREGEQGRISNDAAVVTLIGKAAFNLRVNDPPVVRYMKDGEDGQFHDLKRGEWCGQPDTVRINRKILLNILENMTSDAVDIVLYGENCPIDVHGLIGERSASAIIAPIIHNGDDDEEVTEE